MSDSRFAAGPNESPGEAIVTVPPIGLGTVLGFLVGRRSSIERIAASRQAMWLGLAFVVLAGLFREYDQESLLHEPWFVGFPLMASLGLSGGLFLVLKLLPEGRRLPLGMYRQLLTCLWMTAPLAIVYAIPVERLETPLRAMQWNMSFLAVVAVWRVLLFARVTAVLIGSRTYRTLVPILLLSATLIIIAMFLLPIPLLQIMGGTQFSEAEVLMSQVRENVLKLAFWAWLILPIVLGCMQRDAEALTEQAERQRDPERIQAQPRVALTMWGTWGLLFLGMLAACVETQPPQYRRYEVERLLKSGRYAEARDRLLESTPVDYPPYWEPGHRGFSDRRLFEELEVMLERDDLSEWVVQAYAKRIKRRKGYSIFSRWFWAGLSTKHYRLLTTFFERYPEQRRIMEPHSYEPLLWGMQMLDGGHAKDSLAEERRERIVAASQFLDLFVVQMIAEAEEAEIRAGEVMQVQQMFQRLLEAELEVEPAADAPLHDSEQSEG